jgi:hypothetical protein
MANYYCCLPVDSEWRLFVIHADKTGGAYTKRDSRTDKKACHGDASICWSEFETTHERDIHIEDEHFFYIEQMRAEKWNAFNSRYNAVSIDQELEPW